MLLVDSIKELADMVGTLPGGDTPAAWYASVDPKVLEAYANYQQDHTEWRERMQKLWKLTGLTYRGTRKPWETPQRIRVSGLGDNYLLGLIPPSGLDKPPMWWRLDKAGLLVPRKRTRAEKASAANKLFTECRFIPRAVDYLPNLPNTLWTPQGAYPVHVRKPGEAVLVFLGKDPDTATPPFEPGEEWERLKLSVYWALRERQAAST